ncbi:MAG: cupin domain-containing protein [Coprococcus sp.]
MYSYNKACISHINNKPCVMDVNHLSRENRDFRTALWTGCNCQMTLMCIHEGECIGIEVHEETDQMIRVEAGCGIFEFGPGKCNMMSRHNVKCGDVVFVPAGTWHNITNVGDFPLKLSSVYAPPHHPWNVVQEKKNS